MQYRFFWERTTYESATTIGDDEDNPTQPTDRDFRIDYDAVELMMTEVAEDADDLRA